MTLKFDGISKDYVKAVERVDRPYGPSRTVDRTTVKGRRGTIVTDIHDGEKIWTVEIVVKANEEMTIQDVADDMVRWLYHETEKPLELPNEPDRFYYAYVDGAIEKDEIVNFSKCTITFVCPEGVGYSKAESYNTAISDSVDVLNLGTTEADMIVESVAYENSTMFMISKGTDDYFMLGKPTDAYKDDVDTTPPVWLADANGFNTFTRRPNGTVVGEGVTSQYATGNMFQKPGMNTLNPNYADYETRGVFHGPVYRKSLDNPVQDFYTRAAFKIERWGNGSGIAKAFVHLYDESGKLFLTYGIIDTNTSRADVHLLVRLYREDGAYEELFYSKGYSHSEPYDDRWMWISVERKGNQFFMRTWHRYTENGIRKVRSEDRLTFNDNKGDFSRTVAMGDIAMARHNVVTDTPYLYMKWPRVNDRLDIDDVVPHLIKEGDEIVIDTRQNLVLLNDEPMTREKDLGSNYFKIDEGLSTLLIEPQGKFDTTVKWYDTYK